MAQYISKSALIAQIERIKEMYCYDAKTNASFVAEAVINSINNAINSLEVKEVDLDGKIDDAKDLAMRDIAWKIHCMISEGKGVSEIDHYVCGICDF